MRMMFFGIYELGMAALTRLLAAGLPPVGVVTKLQEGPALRDYGTIARKHQLPLFALDGQEDPELPDAIEKLRPDLILVSGFHRLIPPSILNLAPKGGLNVHPSLLPKYRGPCPWKWTIVNGERETGVTIHQMDESFDGGRILAQVTVPVGRDETSGELYRRLCEVGGELLVRTVRDLMRGRVRPRPQDHSKASHFGAPTDEDARIDWSGDSETIRNLVRGFNPRPGAWTTLAGERFIVHSVTPVDGHHEGRPGTILQNSPQGMLVRTGGGVVLVKGAWTGASNSMRPGMAFESPKPEAAA
jgi:methionyl-tRNA formyltransferase